MSSLHLTVLPGTFAICRLPLDSDLPMWFLGQSFFAMLRNENEATIVCRDADIPEQVEREGGWSALKLEGSFAFTETGILAQILKPLADAKVGIFAVSSFETDYVLIKAENLKNARLALEGAGIGVSAHD